MKKIDKLLITSFIGPFLLTFIIVVFILLTVYMLKYFDDFVGKGLGMDVFTELIMYFSINMTPNALPLAVLLSSLMTFGNLGEHSELTAIKASGISLLRTLKPLFLFVLLISFLGFLSNNYVVPRANLKAYSLLYDIKQKRPSLDIQEGVFYSGLNGFRIKVNEKLPDGVTIKDIIIYDHREGVGNNKVTLADSGKMYTVDNDRYLMLELYDGNSVSESGLEGRASANRSDDPQMFRNNFKVSKMRFSLADFELKRTDRELFAQHRKMKNMGELSQDIDSMASQKRSISEDALKAAANSYTYHLRDGSILPQEQKKVKKDASAVDTAIFRQSPQETLVSPPSDTSTSVLNSRMQYTRTALANRTPTPDKVNQEIRPVPTEEEMDTLRRTETFPIVNTADTALIAKINEEVKGDKIRSAIDRALSQCRYTKNKISVEANRVANLSYEINKHKIERGKKLTQAISCIIMFLIGAPLGAIIKRGGLGVPVIVSICFFIVFYVLSIMSEKWANEGLISPVLANWAPNIFLFPFGLVFLLQARVDARIFETDFYRVIFDKLKNSRIFRKKAELNTA
jgi:lipopolysaccharide export system permease protein